MERFVKLIPQSNNRMDMKSRHSKDQQICLCVHGSIEACAWPNLVGGEICQVNSVDEP